MVNLKYKNFINIITTLLSGNVEDVCKKLNQYGIITHNEDGTFKTFDEVLKQFYKKNNTWENGNDT